MQTSQEVITDTIVKQVASLAATGSNLQEIATSLSISKYYVKKVLAMDSAKALIKEIGDEATSVAKNSIRTKVGLLAKEVGRVIEERLSENDLEAVKVALKIIGFDAQEQGPQETNINVILPGQSEPKPIDGEFRTIETHSYETE